MILSAPLIDAIIVAVGAEFVLIALILHRADKTRWVMPAFWFLASGALLMAALRLVLSGYSGMIPALPLIGSLITHLAFIATVWRLIKKPGPR